MYTIHPGFDTAVAPPLGVVADLVKDYNMAFMCPYIGGPYSGGSGYSKEYLKQCASKRLKYILPVYVGQQRGGLLTQEQGIKDAAQCQQLMSEFGYNKHAFVALDIEEPTSSGEEGITLEYCRGFCTRLNHADFYPGIYGSPYFLRLLQSYHNSAAFIWVAEWVSGTVNASRDPRYAGQDAGLGNGAWPFHRVWQHEGNVELANYTIDLDTANFRLNPTPV